MLAPLDHRTLHGLDRLADWAIQLEHDDRDGSYRARVIAHLSGRLTEREIAFWREVFGAIAPRQGE